MFYIRWVKNEYSLHFILINKWILLYFEKENDFIIRHILLILYMKLSICYIRCLFISLNWSIQTFGVVWFLWKCIEILNKEY